MNWYSGSITEAVTQSKVKNAIFVVYIEGTDEMSTNLTRHVNDDRVSSLLESNDFVAIKIDGNSQAYVQFMSIYKVVPIPSMFFIGNSGTPLDIATGVIASPEELLRKIDTVLITAGKKSLAPADARVGSASDSLRSAAGDDSQTEEEENKKDAEKKRPGERQQSAPPTRQVNNEASAVSSAESSAASPTRPTAASVMQNSAAPPRSVTNAVPAASIAETSAAAAARATLAPTASHAIPATVDVPGTQAVPNLVLTESEQRLAHVQKIIEEKRAKEREAERRKQQQLQPQPDRSKRDEEIRLTETAQSWQRQQELRNLQESIRRDRLAAQEERDRIRAQIAADRAERAQASRAFEPIASASSASLRLRSSVPLAPASSVASSSSETRLQFRLPGGIQKTKAFSASDSLGTVRSYVQRELLTDLNVRDFVLATNYPRRQFSLSDDIKTLAELNLIPNAIVLVLKMDPADRLASTGGGFLQMVSAVLWALVTPAAKAFDYVSSLGFRNFANRVNERLGFGWKRTTPQIVEIQAEMRNRRNTDVFIAPITSGQSNQENGSTPGVQKPTPGVQQPIPGVQQPIPGGQRPIPTPSPVPAPVPATVAQPAPQHPDPAAPKRNYSGEATIHRLRDSVKDDDDKATYNGNSTQQQ